MRISRINFRILCIIVMALIASSCGDQSGQGSPSVEPLPSNLPDDTITPISTVDTITPVLPTETVTNTPAPPTETPTLTPIPSIGYRITINGFDVKSETWDHALEVDGKGDEVYIFYQASILDSEGKNIIVPGSRPSLTLGDTNGQPGRIQAGSRSSSGGLKTNDCFPKSDPCAPYIRDREPDIALNYPPMVVWEGCLTKGQNAVAIVPTIWEWDGGQDVYGDWTRWLSKAMDEFGPRAQSLITPTNQTVKTVFSATELGFDVALSLSDSGITGQASDRPIGFQRGEGGKYDFTPYILILNFESARYVANNQPFGLGQGVVAFNYRDADQFKGNYTIYLQVQTASNLACSSS